MKKTVSILIFAIILSLFSCKNEPIIKIGAKKETKKLIDWKDHWEKPIERAELLSNPNIHERIKECIKDTAIVVLTSFLLKNPNEYPNVKSLGDINNDGRNDSILIIPELYITANKSYENGASPIFTNKNIPRIRVDVSCLETEYIFPVADIDEDGVLELGKYYTSCASRFKRLELISLQNSQWKTLGAITFDTWYEKPEKEKRIRKIGLNKFQMREITSENIDDKIDIWKTFKVE